MLKRSQKPVNRYLQIVFLQQPPQEIPAALFQMFRFASARGTDEEGAVNIEHNGPHLSSQVSPRRNGGFDRHQRFDVS
jgi:hypothetical protein